MNKPLALLHSWRWHRKTHEQLGAVAEGLRVHGFHVKPAGPSHDEPADLHVCWSRAWRDVPLKGGPKLFIENGYLGDRVREYTSVAFDDINGWGRRPAPGDPSRGAKWWPLLRPWQRRGHYILITGQVHEDLTVKEYIPDYPAWVEQLRTDLVEAHGLEVRFRPHPKYMSAAEFTPLSNELRSAERVVTFNSNSAVDALLHGVPTTVLGPGSMAAPMAGHFISGLPPTPDRDEWVNTLAWAQWSQDEHRKGDAWAWMKQIYDQ